MQTLSKFFRQLPLLQGLPIPTMTLAIYEAAMYTYRLKRVRLDVFPPDEMD